MSRSLQASQPQKTQPVTEAALSGIVQGKKETLWFYIDWFTQVIVEVDGALEGL